MHEYLGHVTISDLEKRSCRTTLGSWKPRQSGEKDRPPYYSRSLGSVCNLEMTLKVDATALHECERSQRRGHRLIMTSMDIATAASTGAHWP